MVGRLQLSCLVSADRIRLPTGLKNVTDLSHYPDGIGTERDITTPSMKIHRLTCDCRTIAFAVTPTGISGILSI